MVTAAKKDYYEILGVAKTATDKQVKAAYRRLARKYHPDVNKGDQAKEAKFNCHARTLSAGLIPYETCISTGWTTGKKAISPRTSAMPDGVCKTICTIWLQTRFGRSMHWTQVTLKRNQSKINYTVLRRHVQQPPRA